ncbi:DUF3387 domain-containing protein (plasmid) [Phormidium sp. CLA17]|uniref:type I restriction enzyme endonuclease domain-containing protein n=1 Tax=Leptolyngbya sp. Cla-17 TaxID=2803751 RepID=UPI001490CA31|nr:type I restriction enzyme endonuclease domain-containing protein [Leptolyngbya sp. Cla-17]MBM0745732.1 DUF3387 domain-containing protein [Leptolyngbya sp. Cla-17]
MKRLLRKYSYPPDKAEEPTQTVIQQAETFVKLGIIIIDGLARLKIEKFTSSLRSLV